VATAVDWNQLFVLLMMGAETTQNM